MFRKFYASKPQPKPHAVTLSDGVRTVTRRALPSNISLKTFALRLEREEAELLAQVATALHLKVAPPLTPPSPELVERTHFSADYLRQLKIVPQEGVDETVPYRLVVADPAAIDCGAFSQIGVPLELAFEEAIEECWACAPREGKLEKTLIALAEAASGLGANELFLGHPDSSRYEFVAHGRRFTGVVEEGVFIELLERLSTGEVKLTAPTFRHLSVSLSWNGSHRIACLRWHRSEEESNQAAFEPPIPTVEQYPCARTVLLIDDDPLFLKTVATTLRARQWEVTLAHSGTEALEKLATFTPTLILCDVHMPGMNGLSFVRHLRRRGRSSALIVLTSDEDRSVEAELILLGVDAFVRKNDDPRILFAWCQNLISRENQKRALAV